MKRRFLMLVFVMLTTTQSYGAAAAFSLPFEKEGLALGLTHEEIAQIRREYPVSEATTLANFYDSVLWYFQEKVIHDLQGWVQERISTMTSKEGDSESKAQGIATFVKALKDKEAEKKEQATVQQRPTPGKLGARVQQFEQPVPSPKEKRTPPPTRAKPQSSPSLARAGLEGAAPSTGSGKKGPPPPVRPKNKNLGLQQSLEVSAAPTVVPAIVVEEPAYLAPVGAQESAAEEILVREAVAEELSGAQVAQNQAEELLERNAQILAEVSSSIAVQPTFVQPVVNEEEDLVVLDDKEPRSRVDDDEIIFLDEDDAAVTPHLAQVVIAEEPAVEPVIAELVAVAPTFVQPVGEDEEEDLVVLDDEEPRSRVDDDEIIFLDEEPIAAPVVTSASVVSSKDTAAEKRIDEIGAEATEGRQLSSHVRERFRTGILAAAAAEKERRVAQEEAEKNQALQDLRKILQSRYEIELVEQTNLSDLTSDQAMQLLQDPTFQDEYLQREIKRLMSAPDGTFDEVVVVEALGMEDGDFNRFVTHLVFSSKTPEELFKTDFRRFDRAFPELLLTEQTQSVLKRLIERNESFLKQWLKSLQEREHSPHLTGDQIKEDLIGQVQGGQGYTPSDRALDVCVSELLALQDSMQVPESSSTLDALFKNAGPSIRKSLDTAEHSASQSPTKQGIDSLAHRIGFSSMILQIGTNKAQIRNQMEQALKAEEALEGATPTFSFETWKDLKLIQEKTFKHKIRELVKSWIEHAQRNSKGSFAHGVELTEAEKSSLEDKIIEMCIKLEN